MDLLLLHPPAAKPAEPPLGVAVLLAHLRRSGFAATAIDASLGAYLHLLDPQRLAAAAGPAPATALHRALRHAPAALALLRSPGALASAARYATAARHLSMALSACGGEAERLTLGDYTHDRLSPFAPADLERLAAGAASTLFASFFREELLPRVEALRPRLVALSVNYLHQVLPAFELAGLLRRRLPGVTLVGGGGVFTSWRGALQRFDLRFSCFDRIVLGPGEGPLTRLAAGEAGEGYFLEDASEIAFVPDFSFATPADYLSPHPVLPVAASRGCYWGRCLFCPEASALTHPYAPAFPAAFPGLLRELAGRFGARHFHLTDNAIPLPVLRALAARAEELAGLCWHGFVRFEPALGDPTFARALASAGCAMLQLGLESGSQPVLDRLGKGTRLADAGRILENLKEAGIASYVYVLLGTPGETPGDAEATLAFLEEHADAVGYLNLAIMNLPRDSAMLADPRAFGIAAAELLEEAEPLGLYRAFTAAAGWDRAAARRFLDRRLLASPAIRAIVQRTPPFFTSNHAFLFPRPST
jgi:hypothetical protein